MNDKKETIIKYIILSSISGLGPVGQNLLLELENDISRLFLLSEEELLELDTDGKNRSRIRLFVSGRAEEEMKLKAERIYTECESKGIQIITKVSEKFPKRFLKIQDMPVLLYANGNLRINDYSKSVGIIGARRCSVEGKEKAISVSEDAIVNGSVVISGMAKGIDSYAQTAALKTSGYTIAVLGSGPDICYPKEHQALFNALIRNGCAVSEYPPGTIPHRYMFPRRNRIIAGLSDELYVIDAGQNSGTKSTVEYCEKYGRVVKMMDGVHFPDTDSSRGKDNCANEDNCLEKEKFSNEEKCLDKENLSNEEKCLDKENLSNEEKCLEKENFSNEDNHPDIDKYLDKENFSNEDNYPDADKYSNKDDQAANSTAEPCVIEVIPVDKEKERIENLGTQKREELMWEKMRISFELHSLEGEMKAHLEDKELIEKKLDEAILRKAVLEKRFTEIGEI